MFSVSSFVICLLYFVTSTQLVSATSKIEVTKQYGDAMKPNAINIRCAPFPQNVATGHSYLLLQMTRDNQTLASIMRDNTILYNPMTRSGVKAEGHIDVDPNKTFLSVTLTHAVMEDSGLYSCKMLYMDQLGRLAEDTVSQTLDIDEPNLQDLVRHLMAKVSFLESMVQHQQNVTHDRLSFLERKSIEHGTEIQAQRSTIDEFVQQDFDSPIEAFSYGRNSTDKAVSVGSSVTFSRPILDIGGNYDPETGVFTSPRNGFYVFHLLITVATEREVMVNLEVNGEVVAVLFADNEDDNVQSSVSTVVSLKAGDKVTPLVASERGGPAPIIFTEDHFSTFTGYLLKASD